MRPMNAGYNKAAAKTQSVLPPRVKSANCKPQDLRKENYFTCN